ncbi:DUF7093 family protein [Halorussus halophilus]|uniref:DUF7093 family protein n=1 Tax=Halorussus halophilus TaxID=2650975 RepID=UPI0013012E2C|nr:oxidoreductase [Halorussus halophilus]
MSLRCSLLGHNYGDAEIEREREEEGTEVVVTVREFKECDRCGERSVVSENKEVTALETPTQSADTGASSGGAGSTGSPSAGGGNGGSPNVGNPSGNAPSGGSPAGGQSDVTMGGQSDTGAGADGQATGTPSSTAPSMDSEFEAPQSAEEDDGVILEDDDDDEADDDRQPGQWPDKDANRSSSEESQAGAWPEVGREDDGYDAEPSDGEDADVQFGGGLTPESAPESSSDDEAEFVNAEGDNLQAQNSAQRSSSGGHRELSSGFTAGASAPSAASPSEDDDVDAEFVCPECNFRKEVANSSMRAGDICPECRRGYIAKE